jgi:hypothetical protein
MLVLKDLIFINVILNTKNYRDNNVNYISIADVDLLVSYFDSDRDNTLTYNE